MKIIKKIYIKFNKKYLIIYNRIVKDDEIVNETTKRRLDMVMGRLITGSKFSRLDKDGIYANLWNPLKRNFMTGGSDSDSSSSSSAIASPSPKPYYQMYMKINIYMNYYTIFQKVIELVKYLHFYQEMKMVVFMEIVYHPNIS